jgi:hypothetical protein
MPSTLRTGGAARHPAGGWFRVILQDDPEGGGGPLEADAAAADR